MEFNPNNLRIAGLTSTTPTDAPSVVFAYPYHTDELPEGFAPDPQVFAVGDVVLVGALGPDGLVDPLRSSAYVLEGPELRPRVLNTFRWANKLREYQPLENLDSYLRGAEAQWEANRVVDL